ncbi:hypothetical protein D1007_52643 [Hordeum vulgare]|nr:hypothetical protein D1007_52643 [Hordeum vulgare]
MSLSPVTRRDDLGTPPANASAVTRGSSAAAAADHAAQPHDVAVTTAAADHTVQPPHDVAATTTAPPAKPPQSVGLNNKDEQARLTGLLLNFTGPTAIPPASDHVDIFSRFGPVVETRAEGFSVAVVVFESSLDAAAAFAGTAKIGVLSPNLVSFRLAYSPSAASAQQAESPQSPMNADGMDHLLDQADRMDLLDLLALEALQ